MERTLLFSLALGAAFTSHAQLSSFTDAPLSQHLLEVNKEWRTMDPSPVGGDRIVHFHNEAERIAMHLRMVRAYLRTHTGAPLTAMAAEQRARLLDRLNAYADRGTFPINDRLPYRNPVFIDPKGTACAVGQLIIESGQADLSKRISMEMNLAYVHDMHRPDVDAWAAAHGFTENELAWIQPGYPPPTAWTALGGGTNGTVTALRTLNNNDLLLAGEFTTAGGTPVTNVSRYDGTFHPYGAGVQGTVDAAVEFGGSIYLGGTFNNGLQDIATWNGSTWQLSTAFAGKYAHVSALCEHNGSLYASGESSGFAGLSYFVMKLVGGNWQPVGEELNGTIRTLWGEGDELICGGDFTGHGPWFQHDSTAMHVAVMQGPDWEELGGGLNGSVHAFAQLNDHFYAGGEMIDGVDARFGLAELVGASWQSQLPNLMSYSAAQNGSACINALAVSDGALYFAGAFQLFTGMVSGSSLGRFNGSPDAIDVLAAFDQPVNALAVLPGLELAAGGEFTTNTGGSVPHLASTDLSTGIPDRDATSSTITLQPNPCTDLLTIATQDPINDQRIDILDMQGRIVLALASPFRTNSMTVDVSALAPATYSLRVSGKSGIRTTTFVRR